MRSRTLGLALFLGVLSGAATAQPLGPEFRINPFTTGSQQRPAVVDTPNGFLVVWEGPGNIFVSRFNALGGTVGAEAQVNVQAQFVEAADITRAGAAFQVVWEDPLSIVTRALGPTGLAVGSEFRVSAHTTGTQSYPRVAGSVNGRFVVAWWGPGGTDDYGVFAQRCDGSGPLGAEFRVNSYVTGTQGSSDVAMDFDGLDSRGSFVVVWRGPGAGDPFGIFGQRFASDGSALAAFRVNTSTTAMQADPRVALFPPQGSDPNSGFFVVVWTSNHVGGSNGYDIFGQRFEADGSPLGGEFLVNSSTTSGQFLPDVAIDPTGDFLVTWFESVSAQWNVEGRWFESTGAPAGSEFRVNTYTSGDQALSRSASGRAGKFVTVWHSSSQDGDQRGVYAQRFNRAGDVNGDGAVSVSDILYFINHLFAGGPAPGGGPGDVNGDTFENVSDVLYLINFLFAGGPAPA